MFPDLIVSGHCKTDKSDVRQIFFREGFPTIKRDVASLNDEVLPVLYGSLDDFAHNGPQVIREIH